MRLVKGVDDLSHWTSSLTQLAYRKHWSAGHGISGCCEPTVTGDAKSAQSMVPSVKH
jgi:hypothetical protein